MSPKFKSMNYRKNDGFSLIEMMIAVTVGLMIIAALTSVIVSSGASARANERTSELQSNGRYALDVLKRDMQVAGYFGLSDLAHGVEQYPVGTLPMPGDCYAGFASNITQRVWGTNDGVNPFVAACIPAANYAGSDILVLRYASLDAFNSQPSVAPPADPTGVAGFAGTTAQTLYFRSAYKVNDLYQSNNIPTLLLDQPQQDHIMQVHVYYVAPWTTSAAENPKVPSLRRMVLNNAGVMVDELVASGIENMQVQYSVLDAVGNTQNFDAQNVNPGVAVATDSVSQAVIPAGVAGVGTPVNNWGRVNAVRVWLLSRNTGADRGDGYVNNTVYAMGDQNIVSNAADARFRRQLFTTTVHLRNAL